MTALGDKEYILGRTFLASARLNLQHYLWTQDTGYLIHPGIIIDQRARIADIGTGTGVWLLDVASKFPQAQLEGLDIDLFQTPPQEWLPPNVSLRQWDATSEVPADMVAKFDVVNIRLFMLVIQNQNPQPILHNLVKLLKPGGWLQWSEYDPQTKTFVSASPDISIDAFRDVARYPTSLKTSGGDPRLNASWISLLPTYFERNGIEVTAVDRKDQNSSHLAFTNQVNLMTWEEARLRMNDENARTYKGILGTFGDSDKQTQRGVAMKMKKQTIIGRKKVE